MTAADLNQRQTVFSPCRKYRYTLWRTWDEMYDSSVLMVIGLNPSTADEMSDDPTIRRCIGFAKTWGFGALCMTNLFAWRDTRPENMKRVEAPIGPDNDAWLNEVAIHAGKILAAWGKHGSHLGRAARVVEMLPPMHRLGTNGDGSPKHPLYMPAETVPTWYPK